MIVIQIVPQLPPATNGVGDYALNLARQLRQEFGINTQFIVSDPSWTGSTKIEGFPVKLISDRSSKNLLSLLSQISCDRVLLHYVGYGYAKRGCPVWLVDGLEQWRIESDRRQLITMFHEVYASSNKPWNSSFWLSSLQKNVAARLARLSDRCMTSKQFYANILKILSRDKHQEISALPVFSNIAEPQQVKPLVQRQRQLVVFGSSSNRERVYRHSSVLLDRTCKILGIEKIIDIGSSLDFKFSCLKTVSIEVMGEQPASKISEIFLNSQAGLLSYNPDFLAKSTIFAAYCAHGLLPVSANCSTSIIDGIEPGKHYWLPKEQTAEYNSWAELQAIADNAYAWYQSHSLSRQAKIFATYLNLQNTTTNTKNHLDLQTLK
jgi:SH3-like domain-containing protein